MKCIYNGVPFNIRGSIVVDKNRKKWKVTGSGVRKSTDDSKSCVYLKVKQIEEDKHQNN